MKKLYRSFLLVLMWLGAGNSTFSQNILFNRVVPPEGKTFMLITGMVQDRHGYMWLATKKGLFRYDGYSWVVYNKNPVDSNALTADSFEAMALDSAGYIWLATFEGFGLERFDPATGIFTHYRHDPKNPYSLGCDWITTLYVDRAGTLWIGTGLGKGKGLDRFDAKTGRFHHYRHHPGDSTSLSHDEVRAIYEDKQGTLWIGTGSVYEGPEKEGGLNRMDKRTGKFTRYLHDPGNPHSLASNKVRALFEDSKGNFWVGTAGDGLHTMDRKRGTFKRHPYDATRPEKLSRPPVGGPRDHITFITEDVNGALWIGTSESGLNYYDPQTGRTTRYNEQKDTTGAFTDKNPWWAFTSREGVLWISTMQGSLFRVNPFFRTIPLYRPEGCCFNSFIEDKDGTLWIGAESSLFAQAHPGKDVLKRFTNDPANPFSISSNAVRVIKLDRQGNFWVGTSTGLNLLDRKKGTFTRYPAPKTWNSQNPYGISAIQESENTDLWIGTAEGLSRLTPRTGLLVRYLFHPEYIDKAGWNTVSSVLEDKHCRVWVGCETFGHVHRLDPATGQFKTYLKNMGTTCFYEDRSGTLWVGGNEGLFRYNPSTDAFDQHIDPASGEEFSHVRSLVEDDQQNLWVAASYGISKLNPQRLVSLTYGKSYGIVGSNLRYGSCYKDRNGKLYFGWFSGYYVIDPRQIEKNMKPPLVAVSNFLLENKVVVPGTNSALPAPLSQVKEIRLKHTQDVFAFEFGALDYLDPKENRHLFMLENYDNDWHWASTERKAVYMNVPPGEYVFRVKAANSHGIWAAEKRLSVVVVPPWWSTWWFKTATCIFIITALYGIMRWRMQEKFRRQLEHSEKEKQLADLRHRASELEMQALRAQMNPHFIFNSLNSINRFILQNDKAPASEYLTKFSRLVRLILQNSQAGLVPLQSELEALKLYLELEALRFEQHFEYRIRVDENTDVEALKVPPLVIQPFAENAIWHGLMHKEEKGHLEIDIAQKEEALYCRITDDGIGRKKAAELRDRAGNTHHSMGMRITADRIALLKEQKLAHTSIQVNDLVLPDGSAGGTEVVLKLPVVYDQDHTN